MKTKKAAIIQAKGKSTLYGDPEAKFWSRSCDSAAIGFERLGYKVVGYDSMASDFPTCLSRDTPVRGSVQSFRRVLAHLGVKAPMNVDIPEELMGFTGRRVWKSTVGEVRTRAVTVFVKPLLFQKDFSGHTAYGGNSSVFSTLNLPKSYPLLCQDPTLFQGGELRVYVVEGKIVGKRFMPTDYMREKPWPLSTLENSTLKAMLAAYKSQPAGFCMDVTRSSSGQLVLIEVNEGFSCGNYGIPHELFAKMIEARWKELVSR